MLVAIALHKLGKEEKISILLHEFAVLLRIAVDHVATKIYVAPAQYNFDTVNA
jgi:hypothetical protein